MTTKVIPSLRALFVASGYEAKEDAAAAVQESAFLIVVRGVIYEFYPDYSWTRDARNIYYGGSGGDVALGSMIALGIEKVKTPEAAEKIMRKSIEVAIQFDAFSNGPIVVRTQLAAT